MIPPAKKLRVKMWAKKSKPENSTLEKTTKLFPFISGEVKGCFVVSNSMKRVIRERAYNWEEDKREAEIKELILVHGWQKFCDAPGEAFFVIS